MKTSRFKYFTFRFPQLSKYDIPIDPNKILNQDSADSSFINCLIRLASKSGNDITAFLSYQLAETTEANQDFIAHVDVLFKRDFYKLKPFNNSIKKMLDWLSREKNNLPQNVEREPIASSSGIQNFESIVRDSNKMSSIIERLMNKGVIKTNNDWVGFSTRSRKLELIALIQILLNSRIVHNEPRTQLGRAFCQRFNCE